MTSDASADHELGADELAAAGLYDPTAHDAAGRLELLRWLAARGITVAEMAAASEDLSALAGDTLQRRGVAFSMRDVAARTGMPLERIVETHRAAGLEPVDPDELLYTDHDLGAFELLDGAARLFTWDELMLFLRVMGSGVARISDAANALFLHDIERPMRRAGATELDLAHRGLEAARLATGVPDVLSMYLRLHLRQSTLRSRRAYRAASHPGPMVPMAVGFVDLVGFTPRAATMQPEELADLVARFEATAHDVVTDLGGRLVKLIGDEVMFVAIEPATGCAIAAALLRTFGTDPALTPRGGLAYGEVLPRSGDYFGPTVNLASRIAEQAVPGEILATPEAAADHEGMHVEPAGRRVLKGFADPIALVSITVA